jgi:hypothetical protein
LSRKVVLSLSEHDYEQLELLAKMKRLSVHQLARLAVQHYLDKKPDPPK